MFIENVQINDALLMMKLVVKTVKSGDTPFQAKSMKLVYYRLML